MANKADIKRDNLTDHPSKSFATVGLTNAGKALKPFQFEYQGSVAIHFYKIEGRDEYAFIVQQVGLPKIPEGQADVGFKEMKRTMMSVYGRETKERA